MTNVREEKLLAQIGDLEDRIEELEAELAYVLPPDWFAAAPESYEQMYARLHPHRNERAGTNPAPWSW